MKHTCSAVYFLEQVYDALQCCLGRQLWNSVNDIWLDRNTEMPVVSEVLLSGLSLVLKFMMNGLHPGHLGSAAEGLSNLGHFLSGAECSTVCFWITLLYGRWTDSKITANLHQNKSCERSFLPPEIVSKQEVGSWPLPLCAWQEIIAFMSKVDQTLREEEFSCLCDAFVKQEVKCALVC